MGTHPRLITTGPITTGRINTRHRTRNIALTIAAAASTGLLAAACSSGSSSTPAATGTGASAPASGSASAGGAALTTESTSIGTVLANGTGMTVYWFAADHGTTSACTGACAAAWPPVTGTPSAGSGVPGKLGTITRPGGGTQATYNGHPLYTFEEDTAPGQVNGNGVTGFGATWYAITLTGSAGASSSPAAKTGY